jgi:hypothetical protein
MGHRDRLLWLLQKAFCDFFKKYFETSLEGFLWLFYKAFFDFFRRFFVIILASRNLKRKEEGFWEGYGSFSLDNWTFSRSYLRSECVFRCHFFYSVFIRWSSYHLWCCHYFSLTLCQQSDVIAGTIASEHGTHISSK